MTCHNCQIVAVKIGKDRKGNQRFRCNSCRKTFQELQARPLTNMRLPMEKALLCLQLLVEGNSIRSTERITCVEKKTIMSLLVHAGEKCERLMNDKIKGVAVKDVEADEIWGFVGMKNRAKMHKKMSEPEVGDAYTFVGIERNSKLILAWHLGQRDMDNTEAFTEKLDYATSGHFQLSTDGWAPYEGWNFNNRLESGRFTYSLKENRHAEVGI